jgi:hypothetical protein
MRYFNEEIRILLIRICWKHMFWKLTMTWSDKSHITSTETSPSPPLPPTRNKYPQRSSVHQTMNLFESRPGAKWSLVNACQLDHPLAGLFAHSAHLMKGPFGYCKAHSVWKLRMTGISASALNLALFILIGLHVRWYKPASFHLIWLICILHAVSQQAVRWNSWWTI